MARKKCKECLTCFNLVWIGTERYYHCWFCNTWYQGRDDNLKQVESPYSETPIVLEEQDEDDSSDSGQ